MGDKYINATAMIARLKDERRKAEAFCLLNQQYAGTEAEVRVWQVLDAMVSELEKEQTANVAPCWIREPTAIQNGVRCRIMEMPVCQNCGKPMIYYGLERIGDVAWERFECKKCHIQLIIQKAEGEKKIWTL